MTKGGIKLVLAFLICIACSNRAEATRIYSAQTGFWTLTSTWNGGIVPVSGDTVIIQTGHTISVTGNLYNNSTYMFLIIVGTLDLGSTGKISLSGTSNIIIESGGQILGTSNGAQISIGTGGSEYRGNFQGNITGPAYVSNGHSPSTGEGTGGCGCYTPGDIPLPIQLEFFSAVQQGDKIALQWATVSELDFDYFSIERSINGINFTEIGTVRGHGNSNVRNDYSLDDVHPRIGKNYYRLKSTDFDGYTEYFDVVMEEYSGEKEFSIYPNPSDGITLNYMLNFSLDENSTIVIYNSVGVTVNLTFSVDQNNSLTFLNPLNRGVYFVKIVSKNFSTIERLIVR